MIFGLMLISFSSTQSVFGSVSFNSEINLSNTGTSTNAQIAEDGNLYVIWEDGNDVLFKRSTNGISFESFINLSNTSSSDSREPQIAVSGSNVFVVWFEDSDIKIINSTNSGASFGEVTNLSNNSGTSIRPQISVSESNIYVAWQDNDDGDFDILFRSSPGSDQAFGPITNLSESLTGVSEKLDISSNGLDVHLTWSDRSFGQAEIITTSSTSSGSSFTEETNISQTSSSFSDTPQITSSGNNVYVVWKDQLTGSGDIYLKASTNHGNSFGTFINLSDNSGVSNNPKIVSSGSDVFVTWSDQTFGSGDILFSSSSNNGTSFNDENSGDPINLSSNSGFSGDPQISLSDPNLYVAWKDDTFGSPSESDILLISSSDKGENFSSFQKVSDSGNGDSPKLVSVGSNVYVVWEENDILFRSGIISQDNVEFDSSQYTIGDNPIVSFTNTSAQDNEVPEESVTATITSDSDLGGITLELIEDSDTGIFTNSFTLTDGSSSNETKSLHAETNDLITATIGSVSGSATVLPVEVSFGFEEYDFGDIAHLKVTDASANNDPTIPETVLVGITSIVNPAGITITLFETGPDTGVFGNFAAPDELSDNNLIFMIGDNTPLITDTMTFCELATEINENPNLIENFTIPATSISYPDGITFSMVETGQNTNWFDGTLQFSTNSSNSETGTLLASEGDFFTIKSGSINSKGMIQPNTNPSNGAIKVAELSSLPMCSEDDLGIIILPENPTVTATYRSSTDTISILDQDKSGGGGGGLVRPSLVVNALAGIGGGGSAYSSPTLQLSNLVKLGQLDVPLEIEQMIYEHDSSIPSPAMDLNLYENFDYPMIINDKGFVLSGYSTTLETQTLETNIQHTIKLMYYESDKIQHFSLYTNLRDANSAIHQSDTQLIYNDGQELQVIDPNGFFENVFFTINKIDDLKNEIVLEITFANTMDTTDIILRSWDPFLNSFDTYILDAITVVSDENTESPITTYEEPIIEELQSQTIPIWIKNNAAWWSESQIGDSDFVEGIEYLIKNGIIDVPGVQIGVTSTTEIPDWIQNNAGWWSESLITDDDFIQAMQWLVANGVIQI
jgi:hypothetical protein